MLIDKVKEALRLVALDIKALQTSDIELIAQMNALNDAFEALSVSSGVISIMDEGTTIVPAVRTINFAGDAISAVNDGNGEVTVTVNKPTTRYTHYQNAVSDTWVIVHNLNCYPNVVIVDSAETVVQGEYKYDSMNQLTARFIGGFSGKAFLS